MANAVRFALCGHSDDTWCSDRWTAFTRGDDFYIVASGLGATAKISLHASGVCRFAYTDTLASHAPPFPDGDRLIHKWECGRCDGILHTHILSIYFIPVSGGREKKRKDNKKTILLPCPLPGFQTEVAVFLSKTDPRLWVDPVFITTNIFAVWHLPNRGFITLRRRVIDLNARRFQEILRLSLGSPLCVVGDEQPEYISAGVRACLLSEATQYHAKFYYIDPVDLSKVMGIAASWSTRRGNIRR